MQVPLLELLSQQLHGELQFARYQKSLCKLRFIDDLMDDPDLQTMQVLHRLAMSALSTTIVAAKDVIFLCGSQAVAASLKLSGSLTYFHEDGTKTIDSSTWVAEVCLWTPWIFMGDLVADDVSRLALLDAESFCEILAQNPQTHYAAHRYAKDFLASWLRRCFLVITYLCTGFAIADSDEFGKPICAQSNLVSPWSNQGIAEEAGELAGRAGKGG